MACDVSPVAMFFFLRSVKTLNFSNIHALSAIKVNIMQICHNKFLYIMMFFLTFSYIFFSFFLTCICFFAQLHDTEDQKLVILMLWPLFVKIFVSFFRRKSSTDMKVFLSLVGLSKKVLVDTGNK